MLLSLSSFQMMTTTNALCKWQKWPFPFKSPLTKSVCVQKGSKMTLTKFLLQWKGSCNLLDLALVTKMHCLTMENVLCCWKRTEAQNGDCKCHEKLLAMFKNVWRRRSDVSLHATFLAELEEASIEETEMGDVGMESLVEVSAIGAQQWEEQHSGWFEHQDWKISVVFITQERTSNEIGFQNPNSQNGAMAKPRGMKMGTKRWSIGHSFCFHDYCPVVLMSKVWHTNPLVIIQRIRWGYKTERIGAP